MASEASHTIDELSNHTNNLSFTYGRSKSCTPISNIPITDIGDLSNTTGDLSVTHTRSKSCTSMSNMPITHISDIPDSKSNSDTISNSDSINSNNEATSEIPDLKIPGE